MTIDNDFAVFTSAHMEEYVPLEEYEPLLTRKVKGESFDLPASKCDYLMFMSIGLGSSWVLLTAHYVELPWLERSQPEGVELAAWFGLVGTVAIAISLLVNLYGGQNLMGAHSALVLATLNLSVNIFIAFTWNLTVRGCSLFLLFGSLGGAVVGNLSVVLIVPWVAANFPPSLTNAYISGEGLMTVFTVMLQLVQSPGQYRRFSPTIYFVILALPCISSICCILYIWRYPKIRDSVVLPKKNRGSMCPQWFRLKVLKYVFYKTYSEAITWWILSAILPYACATTDPKEHLGTAVLQWCTAVGITGLLLANILSSFLGKDSNFYLEHALLAMTCLALIVVLAMYDIPGGGFWARYKFLLIADVALLRTGFGYITPLIFRDIARKMPERSENASRLMGFWNQIVSMIVKVLMFLLTTTATKNSRYK